MENLDDIKLKLIQRVCESDNLHLLSAFLKNIENKSVNSVSEPDSTYRNEEPMTDGEVEEYFREEEMVLPPAVLEMIQQGIDDVKNGRVHSNEDVEKYFEEWLKD